MLEFNVSANHIYLEFYISLCLYFQFHLVTKVCSWSSKVKAQKHLVRVRKFQELA